MIPVSLSVTMLLLFSESAEGVRSTAGVNGNLSKADVVLIGICGNLATALKRCSL